MTSSLKIWLRGNHNSIRHRYVTLPKEWLEYLFLYRMRGKSWIDFYAARLDRAENNNPNAPLAVEYENDGKYHLEFMKSQGLKPSHKLLDYGCGVCRSGVQFAKFLDKKGYVGVDISEERLQRGRLLLTESKINLDDVKLIMLKDCELNELQGMKFDYIFANSVVTHMPAEDIATMLNSTNKILKDTGEFLFTYAESDKQRRKNIKDFWYSRDEIRRMCEKSGFRFSIVDEWQNDDIMAKISRNSN